ncbi:MAG: hypothetical protein M3285_03780 [Actinomycetota bacterium]|nr:hypothetical protein [Actinomycetota bacterium]
MTCSNAIPAGSESCPYCGAAPPDEDSIGTVEEAASGSSGAVRSGYPVAAPRRRSTVGRIVTLGILAIVGFIAFRIVSTVQTVTDAIGDSIQDAVEASPFIEQEGTRATNPSSAEFLQCVNQLAVYVDTLLQSEGEEERALLAAHNRRSFEYKTVHSVYRRTVSLIDKVGAEKAVDRAAKMLGRACEKEHGP